MNTANRLRFSEAETALFFIPDHSDFCFRFLMELRRISCSWQNTMPIGMLYESTGKQLKS